jgi:hypothetical protein
VLAPGPAELSALRQHWEAVIRRAGLVPGQPPELLPPARRRRLVPSDDRPPDVDLLAGLPSTRDGSVSNASSIALLLEDGDHSLLMLGDAPADVVVEGVERLLGERGRDRLEVDAVKAAHHGSRANVDAALLGRIAARHWLFSSNGYRYGHPDPEAVAQVALRGNHGGSVELVFNYASLQTVPWRHRDPRGRYSARYPSSRAAGARVTL